MPGSRIKRCFICKVFLLYLCRRGLLRAQGGCTHDSLLPKVWRSGQAARCQTTSHITDTNMTECWLRCSHTILDSRDQSNQRRGRPSLRPHLFSHAVVPLPSARYSTGLPHVVVEADYLSPGLGRLQLLRNEAKVLAAAREAAGKAVDIRIEPLTAPIG